MQLVTDRASRVELEHWLGSLQTSLDAIERAITRHENTLEDCRMQEEEAHQEEAISQGWEEEEGDADAEMMEELMEEEERENGEPSEPQGAVETEEVPPWASTGDAISPEEDAFLMQQASQPVDPTAGSHSSRSEAGTISGEMAELSLTSLGQPGPGEDETLQWVSTSVPLVLRTRLPDESGPFVGWGTRLESSVSSPGWGYRRKLENKETRTDLSGEKGRSDHPLLHKLPIT